ncbi:MAG TPA: xanthine dehydrogenase family protein subunit M [Rhodocyclaceae bacterium]|nr:xanthine dehydrogenase family protein subunit M [Rhodocyclaceae bacterium]
MSEMRYAAPKTLAAAVALLSGAQGRARLLAGGTDLLIQMRTGRIKPELLIDIKGIPGMGEIVAERGGYRVGAAVTGMQLIEHADFAKRWPGVVDGVSLIGSIQVKGRATVGGNLCNASPAADSVPALIAAGAVACIVGPEGAREAAVETVVAGPGKTSLAAGEIVTALLLPSRPAHSGDAYLRFTPRSEMDIAVVGAAVNLTLDAQGLCTQARVALGAVASRALLVPEAATALIGTRVDASALAHLADAAREACQPIDDKRGSREFRLRTAGVMVCRAAGIALERARRNDG